MGFGGVFFVFLNNFKGNSLTQCDNDFLILHLREASVLVGASGHYRNINNIKYFNKHKVVNPTLLRD